MTYSDGQQLFKVLERFPSFAAIYIFLHNKPFLSRNIFRFILLKVKTLLPILFNALEVPNLPPPYSPFAGHSLAYNPFCHKLSKLNQVSPDLFYL